MYIWLLQHWQVVCQMCRWGKQWGRWRGSWTWPWMECWSLPKFTHKSVKLFFYLHSIGKHNKDIISHICRLISIVPWETVDRSFTLLLFSFYYFSGKIVKEYYTLYKNWNVWAMTAKYTFIYRSETPVFNGMVLSSHAHDATQIIFKDAVPT